MPARLSQSVSKTQTCWPRQQSQAVGQSGLMLGRKGGGQVAGDEVGGVGEGGLLQLGFHDESALDAKVSTRSHTSSTDPVL